MKIAVVGTGYGCLVSRACFADLGIEGACVDIDQKKIRKLKKGITSIDEPRLKEIVV